MQSSNRGFIVFRLVPRGDRDQSAIVSGINRQLAEIPGFTAFARQPNTLGLRGGGTGLRFALTGSDYQLLSGAAEDLTNAMADRYLELGSFDIGYDTTQAQLSVKVDRDRARQLGIDLDDVASFIAIALDGQEIAEIHQDDEAIPVILSFGSGTIRDPADLENLFVRAGDGPMVPLSSTVELEDTAVAPQLTREERMRAISISVPLDAQYDLESAVQDLKQAASEFFRPASTWCCVRKRPC